MKRWGFTDMRTKRSFVRYAKTRDDAALALLTCPHVDALVLREDVHELPALEAEGIIAVEDSRMAPGA